MKVKAEAEERSPFTIGKSQTISSSLNYSSLIHDCLDLGAVNMAALIYLVDK